MNLIAAHVRNVSGLLGRAQRILATLYILSFVVQAKVAKNFAVYFVPRKSELCERTLQRLGVFGGMTFGEYHLDLIPFEQVRCPLRRFFRLP